MNKRTVKADMKFMNKCYELGLDCENFDILDGAIVAHTVKENILVLLDEHYNIIDIHDKVDDVVNGVDTENILIYMKNLYENTYFELPYPFQDLSLKQIVEIANRVEMYDSNNGHSFIMMVNEEMVNDKSDSIYVSLLSYIKFLGKQVEKYFVNLYQMRMMGLEYPDIYSYITNLIKNIDLCIEDSIQKNKRPFPKDVMEYLGLSMAYYGRYENELDGIIDLILRQKGKKVNGWDKIESSNEEVVDLSNISTQLLKILEVSDMEVEKRYQERIHNFEYNKVNIESWLSGKPSTLKK